MSRSLPPTSLPAHVPEVIGRIHDFRHLPALTRTPTISGWNQVRTVGLAVDTFRPSSTVHG